MFASRTGQNNTWNSSSHNILNIKMSYIGRKHYKVVKALMSQLFLDCVSGLKFKNWCMLTNEVDKKTHEVSWVYTVCNETKEHDFCFGENFVGLKIRWSCQLNLFLSFFSFQRSMAQKLSMSLKKSL